MSDQKSPSPVTHAVTQKHGPLPLILGVTGHRDLRPQDVATLEDVVRKVFHDLKAQYPHTPLCLLSPLGEGSDRLVARVALDEGIQLFVPLPLPIEIYQTDFTGEASVAEFNALVKRANEVWVLPWVGDNTATNCAEPGAHRDVQYGAMGVYIGRHSQILLALWDGDTDRAHERTGGTAQIVRFRLEGAPPPFGPPTPLLDAADTGNVLHIPTPRLSNPNPQGEVFKPHEITSNDASSSHRSLHRFDIFNRDAVEAGVGLENAATAGAKALVGDAPQTPTVPVYLQSMFAIYDRADALSIRFAKLMWKSLDRVFILVLAAALAFNLFHSLPHGEHGEEEGHDPAITEMAEATGLSLGGGNEASTTPESSVEPGAAPAAHGKHAGITTIEAPAGAHIEASHEPPHGTGAHEADAHGAENPASETHGTAPAATPGGTEPHGAGTHGEAPAAGAHRTHRTPLFGQEEGLSNIGEFELAGIPWLLWLYLLVVGGNLLFHRRVEKQGFQNKYQDYRALAEGLRVQLYWRLAGVREEVDDHYLGKQRSELDWIRQAIKASNVLADSTAAKSGSKPSEWLPLIQKNWVEDQREYYTRKAERELEDLERDEKRISSLVIASVTLTILLALALALPVFVRVEALTQLKEWIEDPLLHGLIMVTIVMLAVCAGLLHSYNQQKARAEHSKRFGRMGLLFHSAERHLQTLLKEGREHNAQIVIHHLGREALAENGDWVLLHRERPLEVPHAG